MKLKKIAQHLYKIEKDFYTECPINNFRWYGERTRTIEGMYLRYWDPYRSKLSGALKKGLKLFPFKEDSKVLYLGASTGTTISHLSDIVRQGLIFGVEISAKMVEKLVKLSEIKNNVIPIMADARRIEEYKEIGTVDIIYEDVSQPDQANILIKNANAFLKKGGIAMLCIKSQSIDVTKDVNEVYNDVKSMLSKHFIIKESIDLHPYDKLHLFLVLEKI